jgi:adenylate cyclase
LAHHYGRSANAEKGAEYLQRAGLQAFARSAHQEALNHLNAAIELLGRLPESLQRDNCEADLQLSRTAAMQVLGGLSAQGLDHAFSRAAEIGERTGNTRQFLDGLRGLQLIHFARAEYQKALVLGNRLLEAALARRDPISISWARQVVGQTQSYLGEFPAARSILEQAVAEQHEEDGSRLTSLDRRVICRFRLGQVLVLLGYADQGLRVSLEAVAIARSLSRPNDLAISMSFLASTQLMVGDHASALVLSETLIDLVKRNELTGLAGVFGNSTRGYVLATQGNIEGVEQMEQSMAALRTANILSGRPWTLGRYAEALQIHHRPAESRSVMAEALEQAQSTGEGMFLAELHRLEGELALAQDSSNPTKAEQSFRTAIEIARRQEARWWELRATTSLARMLSDTERRDEARAMLSEIYNWFTEGFDTADLKDAKALLDELGA